MTVEMLMTALGAALVGAVVTMVGWVVTDLQRRRDARTERLIEFIKRQIDELYAPMSMRASKELGYRRLRDDVSRCISEDRRAEVWMRLTGKYIVPLQKEIFELLQDKRHLFVEEAPPLSFSLALEHCARSLVLFELDVEGVGSLANVPASPMPDDFSADVERILNDLQSRLNRLLTS